MDLKVGKIYKLQQKIGCGSFGEIYSAIHIKTNEQFAVKLEPCNTKQPQLIFESKVYSFLHSDYKSREEKGIPKIYYSGIEGDYNIIVLEILGKSLENLFEEFNRKFTLKTVLMLGLQCLTRIEFLHSKQFLHRDLKPENFLIGLNLKRNLIYLIDFGLSKKYKTKDNFHIPYCENKNLTGTASVNTHLGIEQSRRDDLESLGYILIYFLKGVLPWMNQPGNTQKEKYDNITTKKQQTSEELLCENLPEEFIKYSKKLQFEEKPDYYFCKRLFRDAMIARNLDEDYQFDWMQDCNAKKQKTEYDKFYLPKINQSYVYKEKQQQNLQSYSQNDLVKLQKNVIILEQMKKYNMLQQQIRKKIILRA